jgi:large subunit ribosomal protein L34
MYALLSLCSYTLKTLELIVYVRYNRFVMSVTYQPKRRKRQKTHGFLVRGRTPGGRAILKRRRLKGRTKLAV